MLNAVGDDLDRQLFGVADGFFPGCAATYDSGQFHRFGNPPAIFLAIEFNGENHRESIPQFVRNSGCPLLPRFPIDHSRIEARSTRYLPEQATRDIYIYSESLSMLKFGPVYLYGKHNLDCCAELES